MWRFISGRRFITKLAKTPCTIVKMSDSTLSKSLPPVHVMTQIPGVPECLEREAPPGLKFNVLKLPKEFSPRLELTKDQLQCVSEAEIVLCDTTLLAKALLHSSRLKWAHCTWAGVEPIISAAKSNGIQPQFTLTRHGGRAFSTLMAEYVICQIINWERHLRDSWKNQEVKIWGHANRFETYRALSQLVVCVLGVGNMGCSVARFLKNFGAVVLGFSRSPKNLSGEYSCFDQISMDLNEVISKCDYLCNTLPSTPETFHMLDGKKLSMCSKKPVFINVGRGCIIQEESLIQALRNEWISGAILDVFEKEPLEESSVLWDMPQVVVTPHVACVSTTEHIVEEFLKNYRRFVSGEELKYKVNWDAGY